MLFALPCWSLISRPFARRRRQTFSLFGNPVKMATNAANTKPDVLKVDDIPTWPEYFESALKPNKVPIYLGPKPISGLQPIANDKLNVKISLLQGDITKLALDAIVNAANNELKGGGGVDGAIHKAAGSELLAECATLNGCKTGCAKITKGYKLPAKYVIHTVGPVGEKPELLQTAYESCLNLAIEKKLKTIAFPCISTGVYGYPPEKAAIVALKTIRDFLEHDHNLIERIVFCVFLDSDKTHYEKYLPFFFPFE